MNTLFNPTSALFRRFSTIWLSLLFTTLSGCGKGNAVMESMIEEAQKLERVQDRNALDSALHTFQEIPALEGYFAKSYGCAVFPTIGRAGMGIGGSYGKGWVFERGTITGETSMTQVTVGFQLGGQAYSQIIFFEDKSAYDNFTRGNFELGAQASAVALTVGASAQADTAGGATAGAGSTQYKQNYTNGMAIFTVAKGGLMYEASVGGQKFNFRPL